MSTILTSLHGAEIGLDTNRRLTVPAGIAVDTIAFGVSDSETTILSTAVTAGTATASNLALLGSAKQLDGFIAGDAVNAASTAANAVFGGTLTLSSATKAYTIATPIAGRSVKIIAISSSTGNRTVEFAAGGTYLGGSNDKLTFTTANAQVATIHGVSTAKAAVLAKSTTVTLGT